MFRSNCSNSDSMGSGSSLVNSAQASSAKVNYEQVNYEQVNGKQGNSEHLHNEHHFAHSESMSSSHQFSETADPNNRNFSALFSQELTPNKRAIMEAMLNHWVSNPSQDRVSDSTLSQAQTVSTAYPLPVQAGRSASPHFSERRAS